ncbi:MAG: GspH/FimT family pseudopilin [Rhodanobacteraceae bacterium]|mgnify:FL=1|jgi:type IV fimbrial biogenesis protein FimT|nr:GspH/FimT family pseudopilin [Rhodanobacteraceae bacterium]MBL0041028.1 GspH/FimT family pseudopilin [Xanthomonadales bacterium]MBP6079621.1 GspH/FimT family pseudopilin [Xanthomonadales bacterium]
MTHARSTGFTLIELMIAVALVAILAGIALPSYASARAAAQTLSLRNALLAALTESRNAAAFYEHDTILCPSLDGESCADSFEWQRGFIAAIDLNNNERIDDADRRLLYRDEIKDVRLLTSSGRKRIQFQPNGSNAGSNATFTFCDARGPTRATALVMNNRGDLREDRPSATAIAAACRI